MWQRIKNPTARRAYLVLILLLYPLLLLVAALWHSGKLVVEEVKSLPAILKEAW